MGENSPKMFRGGYSNKRIYFINRACPNSQQLHPEKTPLPLVLLALLGELVFHGISSAYLNYPF